MLYTVNSNDMKRVIFSNILARTIAKTPGMENFQFSLPTNRVVANFLGMEYNKVKEYLFNGTETGTEAFILMRSVIKSIDKRVDKFSLNNIEIDLKEGLENDAVAYAAYRKMVAMEAEEEKEEEGNPFGETVTESDVDEKVEKDESTIAVMVAELIKEIVNTDASEVTDLAERVVELSKENNDMKKELAEDDEDIFSTVDDENEDGEEGETKEKTEDGAKGGAEDGGNPFEDTADKNEGGSDNPFDDEPESSKDDDGKNPFDDEPDTGDTTKKEKSNPFDDDDKKEDKDNDDKTGEENQTKKLIKNLQVRSFGLEKEMYTDIVKFKPFAGLENDSFNNLAKYVADKLDGENLYNAYTNFGVESTNYSDAKQNYSKTAKETMSAGIGVIMLASILNIPVESHKLNNIELFAE